MTGGLPWLIWQNGLESAKSICDNKLVYSMRWLSCYNLIYMVIIFHIWGMWHETNMADTKVLYLMSNKIGSGKIVLRLNPGS